MMVVVMDKCEEQRMGMGSIRKPTGHTQDSKA